MTMRTPTVAGAFLLALSVYLNAVQAPAPVQTQPGAPTSQTPTRDRPATKSGDAVIKRARCRAHNRTADSRRAYYRVFRSRAPEC